MKTLMVTGSNGLLGTKLIQQALGVYRVVALSRNPPPNCYLGLFEFYEADIRDRDAVSKLFGETRPDIVVHTAAMTNVDACELAPDEAWAVNVTGTEYVAKASGSMNARVIFLSSDYVFAGDCGPYAEDDVPTPLSVYGRTKLAAERLVIEQCPNFCIARTGTLYGYAPSARPNFVTWLAGEVKTGTAVDVVTDQISSPTLADNLAEMVLAMTKETAHGIYHAAGAEWLSRYDFALRIARCYGLDARLIQPVETAALKQAAPRPRHSGLFTRRVAEELGVRPLPIDEGLVTMRSQQEAMGK